MKAYTVPTIFTAVDKFSGVVFKMQTGLNRFSGAASEANAKFQRQLSKISNGAKSVAQSTAVAGLAVAAPLIYAAKEAATFEHNMAKVKTLVGANSKQMVLMGRQVLGITQKIPVSLEDVARGLYIINSAGIMGAKGMDMVTNSSKLAVAGLGTVEQASHLMSSVFTVFGSEGYTSAEMFNKLALVVRQGKTTIDQMTQGFGRAAISVKLAGVHLNEFLSMVSALTVKGSTASEAYTQIQGATQAMLKPNEAMLKAFRALGYSGSFAGQQIIKRFGGLVPAMEAVNKTLDKVGVRRAKAWGRIGAFIAQAALTPGGAAHGHFVENKKAMDTQPNAGQNMFQAMLGTTDSQFTILKNNLRVFAVEIGTKLLPVLTKLAQKITPVLDKIITWTDKNPGLAETIVKITAGLAGFLLVISPIAMTVGLIADGIAVFTTVSGALAPVIGLLSDGFWMLAAAMAANPIGLIIIGIAALIAVVAVIIAKWHDWGAAVSSFLGPLGMVISFIMELIDNWKLVTKGFQDGGILGALKALGSIFVSALLHPMEQMLSIIGKLTGWKWAKNAAAELYQMRASLGVDMGDSQTDAPRKVITPLVMMAQLQSQREQQRKHDESVLGIHIIDPAGYVKKTTQTGGYKIPVQITPTMGAK